MLQLFTYLCTMSAKVCLHEENLDILLTHQKKMTVHDRQCIWCLKMFVVYSVKSWRPTEDVFMSPRADEYLMPYKVMNHVDW